MKKYIILTHVIHGDEIGGSLIYVKNKVNFLKANNYRTIVYSRIGQATDIVVLPELELYRNNLIYELAFRPSLFSQKQISKIIDRILKDMDYQIDDEVIIETHDITEALWGEILAKKTHGKNFTYLINEYTKEMNFHLEEQKFLAQKLSWHGLAVLAPKTYDYLFKHHSVIPDSQRYLLKAPDSNVVAATTQTTIVDRLPAADFQVASIGRLEKPFVTKMVRQVCEFSRRYPAKKIQLTLVGDTADLEVKQNLRYLCQEVPNLNLLITGYLFPIPPKFFKQVDVFVSSAGATLVSHHEGVPTIVVSPESKPLGIMGWTTNQILFGEECGKSISQLLTLILIEGYCTTYPMKYHLPKPDLNREFNQHQDFIRQIKTQSYYPVTRVYADPKWKILLNWLGVHILGSHHYFDFRAAIVGRIKPAN